MTDGDRVLQVITNLLSNALRWTPDGGRVEVGVNTSNGTVSVAVADSGPEITQSSKTGCSARPFPETHRVRGWDSHRP